RTADCVPILIADPKKNAIAAVHAGWRGTALDVAGESIRGMNRAYGTDPADCVAAIGPCICGPCYEVGREVVERLESLDLGRDWISGDRRVDLGVANRALLLRAGVAHIDMLDLCTSCDHRFSSWRRDKNEGRQVNFILLNPSG
ncbi:MAG: laccase domain-containing protein, partial [Proteobacteria bacterium]|nr:laccase domain-containing protein [Pseudomonadota bacterium]